MNKKALGSIIAISLIIIIAIISIISIQTWFDSYQNNLYKKIEGDNTVNSLNSIEISTIAGNTLFIKNNKNNLKINKIELNKINCFINGNYNHTIIELDLSFCLNQLGTQETYNVVMHTDNGIISKSIFPGFNGNDFKNSQFVSLTFGTFIVPMDFPDGLFNETLMEDYFEKTSKIGTIVGTQNNWYDTDDETLKEYTKNLILDSKDKGFDFVYQSNLLSVNADKIGVPNSVNGESFEDQSVRDAYTQEMLRVAGLNPDVLLIGVEVNNLLFNNNEEDFNEFKEYSKDLYNIIKSQYPDLTISISFQWDHMRLENDYDILMEFNESLDIYSISTYPAIFGFQTVDEMPDDYYSVIKNYLPENARVIVAESGWSSRGTGFSQQEQKEYYKKLPELYNKLNLEFVIISYLHDLPASGMPPGTNNFFDKFSSQGLYTEDGIPKEALDVVENYYK